MLTDQVITTIAQRHATTNAQVFLNWTIQRGTITGRLKQNFNCLDFELSKEELVKMDNLKAGNKAIEPIAFWPVELMLDLMMIYLLVNCKEAF